MAVFVTVYGLRLKKCNCLLAIRNTISNIYGEIGQHEKVMPRIWAEIIQILETLKLTAKN
jgi:hypothetical protein